MRKKVIMLYMAVLFAFLLNISVFVSAADGKLSDVVSSYCSEDKMYTFVHFREDSNPQQLSGALLINDITVAESSSAIPVKNTPSKIHYVLLIDLSTSMQEQIEVINRFILGVSETEFSNAVYSVLTFGGQFQSVSQNLSDIKELQAVVNNLQYNETLSDPYYGLEQAIKYLCGLPRSEGELVNLILVSDGRVYLGDMWAGEHQALEDQKAKSTSELIASSPEIILHTMRVGEWDTLADQTFSNGIGLHLYSNDKDAHVLGQELAKFAEELYKLDFSFQSANKDQRLGFSLQLIGTNDGKTFVQEYELKSVPILQTSINSKSQDFDTSPTSPNKNEDDKEKTSPDEENERPISDEKSKEEEPEEEKPQEDTLKEKEDTPKDEVKDPEDAKEDSVLKSSKKSNIHMNQWILFIFVLSLIIVILLLIIAVMLFRRRATPERNSGSIQGESIFMRLDVVSGELFNTVREFHLQDQLIIGRNKKCDIIWKDKCVSGRNTRIYIEDQKIYIEDLNSKEGTVLCGIRLQAPNILRSGEEISIGAVCFIFRF